MSAGYMRKCVGKVRYETRAEAKPHAAKLNKRKDKRQVRPYPCDQCGGYHVGHGAGRGRKR